MGVKIAGGTFTALGAFASGAEFYYSDRSGADYAKLAGAGVVIGSNFIPYVGPYISIGLGVADGAGQFNSFYKSFDNPAMQQIYLRGILTGFNPLLMRGE